MGRLTEVRSTLPRNLAKANLVVLRSSSLRSAQGLTSWIASPPTPSKSRTPTSNGRVRRPRTSSPSRRRSRQPSQQSSRSQRRRPRRPPRRTRAIPLPTTPTPACFLRDFLRRRRRRSKRFSSRRSTSPSLEVNFARLLDQSGASLRFFEFSTRAKLTLASRSGKSSLLQALIGEMKRTRGQVTFGGSIAYCSQQAWIQNTTLKVRDSARAGVSS